MDVILQDLRVEIPPQSQLLFHLPSLVIERGERVLLQGPSGKGKTTLLHIVAGLLRPPHGLVKIGGQALYQMTEKQRSVWRRDNLALIFQKLNLLPHLTSLENVMLMRTKKGFVNRGQAEEALAKVLMENRSAVRAANLSLGEQQRVAVARVLVGQPQLILADEPTSSLDDANALAVMDALQEATKPNVTLLVVSHDNRLKDHFNRFLQFDELTAQEVF